MQGHQNYQPELFTYFDLERLVPQGHLLRRIDRVLDLGFIRELTREFYSDEGRPSIDPEVYFRIQLVGYIYGIESDRHLCEEVSLNIAYRWFARLSMQDQVLDHSSLTRIRDRFGEKLFERVFIEVVNQCKRAGLIRGKRVIVDATLVEANASLKTLEPKNGEDEFDSRGGRKLSNSAYASRVDPESALVARSSGSRSLCHKVHYAADAKERVITSVVVTAGNVQDHEKLIEQVEYCRGVMKLPVEQVVADKGYGIGTNYEYLSRKGIRTYIPVKTDRHRQKREFGISLDRMKAVYVCPEGKHLTPSWHDQERGRTLYRSASSNCKVCPQKQLCPLSKANDCEARLMWISDYESYFQRVRQRAHGAYFISVMRQRAWKIEGLFAEAKRYCGMRRAKYRGRVKMQIQAYMTAIAQNLRRLEANLCEFLQILIYGQIQLQTATIAN